MRTGPRLRLRLAGVCHEPVGRRVVQPSRGEVHVDEEALVVRLLRIPYGLQVVERAALVQAELRHEEVVVRGSDERLALLEADELYERRGEVSRVVEHLHLLGRLMHIDDVVRVVCPVLATVDVLVPDVPSDPLVVESDVGRLPARLAVSLVQCELYVVRVLAGLPVPYLRIVVVLAGQATRPSLSLVGPGRVVLRYLYRHERLLLDRTEALAYVIG